MEFKGTKGKWTVEEKEDTVYDQVVFAISTNHNEEFITVWNGVENLQEEQRANALIISKAPEMLEMLKYISTALENVWNEEDGDNIIFDKIDAELLDNLIKSATSLEV